MEFAKLALVKSCTAMSHIGPLRLRTDSGLEDLHLQNNGIKCNAKAVFRHSGFCYQERNFGHV